jgi:hypothetical protein
MRKLEAVVVVALLGLACALIILYRVPEHSASMSSSALVNDMTIPLMPVEDPTLSVCASDSDCKLSKWTDGSCSPRRCGFASAHTVRFESALNEYRIRVCSPEQKAMWRPLEVRCTPESLLGPYSATCVAQKCEFHAPRSAY